MKTGRVVFLIAFAAAIGLALFGPARQPPNQHEINPGAVIFRAAEFMSLRPAHAAAAETGKPTTPGAENVSEQNKKISYLWILPFAGILLCIAIIPLAFGKWWERNFGKVSAAFCVPMAIAMFFILREKTIGTFVDYLSFIALVGSLFVISGGLVLRGVFRGTPLTNTMFLAIGAVLASFIGTAGASMTLIRPMLRINARREFKAHIFIFFIFIVSNIGGSLTPLGDPPLFLGFLQGVPFSWPLMNLLPGWAFNCAVLLAVFFVVDSIMLRREGGGEPAFARHAKIKLVGGINLLFLFGVLGTVVLYGNVFSRNEAIVGMLGGFMPNVLQILLMCGMAALSMIFTPSWLRKEHGFTWFPVKEVAILFAAIFATMIPTLHILEYAGRHQLLNVSHPWQFFWMSGGLSSFLDNAPTYMTFLSLGKTLGASNCVAVLGGCVPVKILAAISMGSVFMGANTYIGNAPNFMVKSICEENSVKMPSFIHYMGWSIAILIPLFVIDTFLFFF